MRRPPDSSGPRPSRLAVIADVHGNLPALEAVLDDLARRGGADLLVDLGDLVSGPLWPAQTLQRLRSLPVRTIRGNHDRLVATLAPADMDSWDRFAFAALGDEERRWLGGLPPRLEPAPGVLACHGTPADDLTYLVETIRDGALGRDRPDGIFRRLIGSGDAGVILCGHSHRQDFVRLPDGRAIVNPGSVGCPAYADDTAPAHRSESGTPHARYARLELDGATCRTVELLAVAYDWERAAARAESGGRADWAHALRTGVMPPLGHARELASGDDDK
ncbi:MAG: metallophosphoesterase family protein [Geminicoccaceae bacterium]